MSYLLLMHPSNSGDCYVLSEDSDNRNPKEFATVDEAVQRAVEYGTSDFWVISKHDWKAVEK